MARQLGFYFNASACIGCKVCQIACKDKNDLPVGVRWRRVYEYAGGSWLRTGAGAAQPNQVFAYYVSLSCMHCATPACTQGCPTGAMHKGDDGIVAVDPQRCVGCRYCEWGCPYHGPQFNPELGRMTKCDFCRDLLAQGGRPVCVDACVMRALDFGELSELRAKYGTVNAFEPLPPADLTNPSVVLTPHKHSQPSGRGTGSVVAQDEL